MLEVDKFGYVRFLKTLNRLEIQFDFQDPK